MSMTLLYYGIPIALALAGLLLKRIQANRQAGGGGLLGRRKPTTPTAPGATPTAPATKPRLRIFKGRRKKHGD